MGEEQIQRTRDQPVSSSSADISACQQSHVYDAGTMNSTSQPISGRQLLTL